MRLILLSIVGLLCLVCAFASEDNGANLEDLLGVAHHGGLHTEGGSRQTRGYGHGNYGRGGGGHGHGGHGYGGYGGHHGGGGHYGR
ncbi:glycine-rich cell wall structural protein-like [Drosophila ficusphila]|uniref:glycine-rich cell wall structural protein-like n=1 Tax=Drosophila ficusphila TaxID=30025 RepID=UPI0007E73BD6|nr:glycine-rich cell wall structural protein-like [Drosophila ficusphila]